MLTLFIIANIFIFLGYVTIGLLVVPSLNISFMQTKLGGFFFFALCAATHIDMAYHAWAGTEMDASEWTSWHMMLIHVPQAIAVWVFTFGLYKEIGRTKGYLRLKKDVNIIKGVVADLEGLKDSLPDKEDVVLLDNAIGAIEELKKRSKDREAEVNP